MTELHCKLPKASPGGGGVCAPPIIDLPRPLSLYMSRCIEIQSSNCIIHGYMYSINFRANIKATSLYVYNCSIVGYS